MRKSADITNSEFGRGIVDILAFGCIEYMIEHGIPLTPQGFERLVSVARETGLNGRIAFQVSDWTQLKLQALFERRTGIPANQSPGAASRLRTKKSIRERILAFDLGELGGLEETERAAFLEKITEVLGPESKDLIDALRHGECQRDLVLARILELAEGGDPRTALEAFRKPDAD